MASLPPANGWATSPSGLVAAVALAVGMWRLLAFVTAVDGWGVFVTPLWQGLVTFGRVARARSGGSPLICVRV